MGAIAVIVAGAMGLQTDPAACEGEGCDQCGWECLTFECDDGLGAQWFHKCVCDDPYCDTEIDLFDCDPV